MALVASCLFAGLTMAQDATAETTIAEGESAGESSGDSSDMDWEAFFSELSASAGTESADGEEAESAEGESEVTEADITASIMTALGLEEYADFDFEAFYADIQERVDNGEELTMEDAFPEFYWAFFTNMFQGSEESGYTVDLVVEDNSMMMYWTFQEELDEDAINEVVESVSTSFESEETMANLKSAMESMSEAYNIDIDDVEMGLEFINGDDSVIYEVIYTYADLEDVEVPETDEEGGSSDSSASSASEAAEEAETAEEAESTKTFQLGTSSYTFEIPESYEEGERDEEDVKNGMVAYMKSPDYMMDFDVYQFGKEGLPETVADLATEEAKSYDTTEIYTDLDINGINVACCRAFDSYEGKTYDTLTYYLDDGDTYLEIVFWLDGDNAEELSDMIISTLSSTKN